eukprot:653076-Rhodomonas_salina.1
MRASACAVLALSFSRWDTAPELRFVAFLASEYDAVWCSGCGGVGAGRRRRRVCGRGRVSCSSMPLTASRFGSPYGADAPIYADDAASCADNAAVYGIDAANADI